MGELQDGWRVQWRAQGVAGAGAGPTIGAWSAWQSLRIDRSKPTVSDLAVSPGTLSSGTWVTSTLEPTLSGVVSDPDSRAVGINIEVQHDPAVPSQGSGLIWSGNQFASQTTGTRVSVKVGVGELQDGWRVQWRAQGVAGAGAGPTIGAWSAWQSLRVDRSKPTVSALQVSPGTLSSGTWITSTLEPTLSAVVSDPDGRAVGINVEVQHDPAVPSQGSGLIWSGSEIVSQTTGTRVPVKVPAGVLRNGWSIQWRAQGVAGTGAGPAIGAWSAWQSAHVEVLKMQWASPLDNTQVGSLTPTLAAYAKPGDNTSLVSYWFQVCAGTPEDWSWCESADIWWESNGWQVPAGKLKWGETYWWKVQARAGNVTESSPWRSFTTTPEQGTINALLASGTGGREFNHTTGNYTQTVTDASVASAGLPLSVVRTYNSLDPRTDGAFGAGWSTRWDMRIQDEPQTKTVLITYPDGREYRFAAKGDGSYATPQGNFAKLATVEGGGWRLMDKGSTSYWFNSTGRLTKITDRRGRSQGLTYGTDGKLNKITAVAGGRSLTFGWTGNHVTSVSTDPVDGQPLTWTYSYTGDTLTKVCPPGEQTACTVYDYTSGSRYSSIVINARPAGYWRLGEAQTGLGGKIASSAAWNVGFDNATLAGTTADAAFGVPGALTGSTNSAMSFKGTATSARVQLPAAAISGRARSLSVEAWFKTTGSGTVIGYNDVNAFSYTPALYVGTDGKLRGQFSTGKAEPITSGAAVNDGNWHHVVLSGAENTQTLFLDGQTVGTLSGTITHNDQNQAQIGYGYASPSWPSTVTAAGAFPFTGAIDEVAVYDKPLGPAEIRTHYAARTAQPHLAKTTLPSGRQWAASTYDADGGRLLTHTDRHGGTWKLSGLQYANNGLSEGGIDAKATVTDPQQETLSYLDDAGRGHRLLSATDQLGKTTSYAYDEAGLPSKITDPNGSTIELSHDNRGNLLASKTCRSSGNCQQQYSSYFVNDDDPFDPRNDQVTTARDARSTSATDNTYATTFDYNSYGEQTKQTTPATLDFPTGRSATLAYTDGSEPAVGGGTTPAGLVKTRTDAKGNATELRYNVAGDLAEQTAPTGQITQFEHDALGRVTTQTQISDAQPNGVKTSYTYDDAGRPATQTAPGVKNEITGVTHTAQTSYAYDPDGNMLTATVTDLTGGDAARTTTYTYDAHGRQDSVTDPEGDVVRTTWDQRGLQATVTDPLGSIFGYTYTERGELAAKTVKNWTGSPVNPQPAAEITLESYAYDPAGRLAAQSDAMGRKTSYTYFGDNLLSQVIGDDVKLNGATTTKDVIVEDNTYDAAGNLIKQVTGGGFTTTDYVYDAAGRLTSTTFDPADLQRKTAYTYDANNLITKEIRAKVGGSREESVTYAYNAAGIKTRQTIENSDQDLTTTWTVDDRGLATAITDPRGNADGATAAEFTTTNTYDALGRLIETKAPSVQVDEAGANPATTRPTVRVGYDTFGNQTHTVDAKGSTLITAYDKAGRVVKLTMPAYTSPGGTAVTPTITHGYDAGGRRTSTTDARGYVTRIDYDALGRPVRTVDPGPSGPGGIRIAEYNLAGEQLADVDPNGARAEATYDDLGRKITETSIERKPTTAAHTTKLAYNDAGMLTSTVDPRGMTTTYAPNAAGEVTSTTDPAQNKTTTTYDLAGRPLRVTDATTNATETNYDLAGRPIEVKDLNSSGTALRSIKAGYDLAGNLISQISAEQHTTKQSFDALNRLTTVTEPVSASEEIVTRFGYDANGARTKLTDGRGNTTWTTYNSLGLVEKVIEPATSQHPDEGDRTWTYAYDQAGNNTGILQPGGVQITRTFDHLGRLTQEDGSGGGAATAQRTFGYDPAGQLTTAGDYSLEYNDRGLLTKLAQPSGQPTTMAYDAGGNLTQRVDAAGTANFTWDNANRLGTATDPVTGRTLTYGYDKANRVTSLTAANPASTQTIGYDDLGRATSQTLKNSTGTEIAKITYGWDKDDNLTTKTTMGLAGAGTNTYGYDHANRLTSWTAPSGATTAYEWDAAGNRTKAGNKSYTYDERNRLTSGDNTTYTYTPRGTLAGQTKNGATTQLTFDAFDRLIADGDSLYAYDAFDRVTSRISGTTKQTHHYAGLSNDLAAVSVSGSIQATYARDPFGALLGLKEGTDPAAAALSDLHGDLVATHTGTAITSSTAYDPFGAITAQTGSKASLGYQGEYTDPDTGKVNMHARWYQPGTATFTSRDSATLNPSPSVQVNRYTYANASPLTGTDPTGHSTVVDTGSLAGGYTSSSGPSASGGTCIGNCYGGGGAAEMCPACLTAGEI
ncbi:LamG-like jellyroll fold domain-containing protein, partial [Nonomuraea sp. KM90]|uniref:LamG-like jellyroll fold domain-containing protein n=1 Tax=Nonomuraea sp. KM90 TaxID=3457428 RepID=UPI003FCE45B6